MTQEELDAALENARQRGVEQEKDKQRAEQKALVTCPLCLGPVDRPKILRCGHTFCQHCIGQMPGGGHDYFSCPSCKKQIWNSEPTMKEYAESLPNNIEFGNIVRRLMDKNNDPSDVVKIFGSSIGSLSSSEFKRLCDALEDPANKVECGSHVVKAIRDVKLFNDALTTLSTLTQSYDDVLRPALDKLCDLTEHDGVMSPFTAEAIREHLLQQHNSFEDRLHEVYHRAPLEAQD